MPKCAFCGNTIREGSGTMFVKATGKISWFCSRKCEKNFAMGRDPKRLKWTKHQREE